MVTQQKPPGMFQVTITAYRCRCGYEWASRNLFDTQPPKVCPKCKSPNWDRPYKFRRPQKD